MSILASLNRAYERMDDAPPFGFSSEKIGFCIALNEDGTVAGVPVDLRVNQGKKPEPRRLLVPQPYKKASGIKPNFLWDKTSYVLGVTAGEGRRLEAEHKAFADWHAGLIAESADAGLRAFRLFLETWTPDQFAALAWPEDMRDDNVVFALEAERLEGVFLHDRLASKQLWERIASEAARKPKTCLVTGEMLPSARLHASIKGVWDAQSSGASIVAFNQDAFTSYGHEQGDNAPVSEGVAFRYTTVLNRYLEKGSRHRVQIGDASTVFWADAARASTPAKDLSAAEAAFLAMFSSGEGETAFHSPDEEAEAGKVADILQRLRNGERLKSFDPGMAEGVRFYVLGLAPNAARISVRFYFESDFGQLADNYRRFVEDTRIEPPPRQAHPQLWQYLRETAVLGKSENVPPNLGGEWMRAILAGTPYPLTLLSTVLMRLRADREVTAMRIAILRAVLVRNFKKTTKEAPVAFDPDNDNRGYLLGRLFAAYEQIQSGALGGNINSTVKDKFYGSASAQPRKVFAMLESGSSNHLSKLGKTKPGYKVTLEKLVGAIMEKMSPAQDPFPVSLSPEEQALFGLGYYHQRGEFFKSTKTETATEDAAK